MGRFLMPWVYSRHLKRRLAMTQHFWVRLPMAGAAQNGGEV